MSQQEKETLTIIKDFFNKLPKFSDGRIDYSNSEIAPVMTIFVKYDDEILLLKRSNKVNSYKGKWSAVAGYLDELKPLSEKILQEIKEELGIEKKNIESTHIGESYKFRDSSIKKTWIIYPALVELKKKQGAKIDWEHSAYQWIKIEDLEKFDIVSSLGKSLQKVLK